MKNNNNGLTNGQKVFLGLVGMLVTESIITNILKVKAQKNYVNMVNGMVNGTTDSSEKEDKK